MEVNYTRTNWEDAPSENTPISAARLNNIEQCLVNLVTQLNTINNAVKFYASPTSENPADIFGGTWERLKGRFLWGIDDGETSGATGGEKTHTLTQNELPNISGKLTNFALQDTSTGLYTDGVFSVDNTKEWTTYGTGGAYSNSAILKFSAGGGKAHNNMPPYFGVYLWRRIS